MNRWSVMRLIGLMVALVLIAFGGIDNLWRTIKFGLERITKN